MRAWTRGRARRAGGAGTITFVRRVPACVAGVQARVCPRTHARRLGRDGPPSTRCAAGPARISRRICEPTYAGGSVVVPGMVAHVWSSGARGRVLDVAIEDNLCPLGRASRLPAMSELRTRTGARSVRVRACRDRHALAHRASRAHGGSAGRGDVLGKRAPLTELASTCPAAPLGGGECAVGRARGRISRGQIQRARCTQGPGNAARVAFAISGRGASPARAAAPPFSLSPRTAVRVIRGVRARAVLPRRRSYTPARPSAPCTSFVPLPVSHPHLRHPVPAPRARPAQPYSHNPACVFAPPQRPHGRPHRHT